MLRKLKEAFLTQSIFVQIQTSTYGCGFRPKSIFWNFYMDISLKYVQISTWIMKYKFNNVNFYNVCGILIRQRC
jgi:hypothetical protein